MRHSPSLQLSDVACPIGVGLKAQHYSDALAGQHELGFFEVHAENYMMDGGNHLRFLEVIGEKYPLSVHGVGMSLGSAEGIDSQHLAKFKKVIDRFNPWLISEHLAWSVQGGHYLNDLLPLPLNKTTLSVVTENVKHMQNVLGRRVLIENPSTYVSFNSSDIPEPAFLEALSEATGCGILLDVNNIYVSARNNGFDAARYIEEIPASKVSEIHLAGHTLKEVDGHEIRIDDHASHVDDDVWALYRHAIAHVGEMPTLVEWDNDIPSFDVLKSEAEKARDQMKYTLDQVVGSYETA